MRIGIMVRKTIFKANGKCDVTAYRINYSDDNCKITYNIKKKTMNILLPLLLLAVRLVLIGTGGGLMGFYRLHMLEVRDNIVIK